MTSERAVSRRYCCLGELLAAELIWRIKLGMYLGMEGREEVEQARVKVLVWRIKQGMGMLS